MRRPPACNNNKPEEFGAKERVSALGEKEIKQINREVATRLRTPLRKAPPNYAKVTITSHETIHEQRKKTLLSLTCTLVLDTTVLSIAFHCLGEKHVSLRVFYLRRDNIHTQSLIN